MPDDKVDLIIIGAGPAGLAAAEAARARNWGVVLIEAGELGGVSHNWGALPAQALAAAAARVHQIRTADAFGLEPGAPEIDLAAVNARIRQVIDAATPEISRERLTARGIAVVSGRARFTGPNTVAVGERAIRARRILIATGSRPLVPDVPGAKTVAHFTPETIFSNADKPAHLIVVGGGATGLSLAQSHLRLGAKVTVIDTRTPLADHDPELVDVLLRHLTAEGLDMRANTGVVSVAAEGEPEGEGIALEIKSGPDEARLTGSHLLFATGRRPVFEGLDLAAAKIATGPAGPILRADGRTANRAIFVAGDAAGQAGTHAARQGGQAAIAAMAGDGRGPRPLARIVHTDPAIVQLGMTEAEARTRFKDRFAITRLGLGQTDAARIRAEPDGHVKLLTREDGRIVGVGIVGAGAVELVPVLALAIDHRLTPGDLGRLTIPYPALAQAIGLLAATHAEERGTPSPAWLNALRRLLP